MTDAFAWPWPEDGAARGNRSALPPAVTVTVRLGRVGILPLRIARAFGRGRQLIRICRIDLGL
jgi:hypothetical protein